MGIGVNSFSHGALSPHIRWGKTMPHTFTQPRRAVLLADHQPLFRRGMDVVLRQRLQFETVVIAGSARQALEFAASERFDCLIVAATLPDLDDCGGLAKFCRAADGATVILLQETETGSGPDELRIQRDMGIVRMVKALRQILSPPEGRPRPAAARMLTQRPPES
jgi:CheY-like chemotaxis protein